MRLKMIGYALLIVMAMASMAFAASGDSDFKFRYSGLVSTTPIADVNALDGIDSNVQDQLDAGGTGTLADTNIFVGNGSNVATAVALTVSGDAAGTGDNTGDIAVSLATGSVDSDEIVAGAVGDAELNITESTINIAANVSWGSATVTAGSTIIGVVGIANINHANEIPVTAILNTTTIYLDTMGAVDTDTAIYNVISVGP